MGIKKLQNSKTCKKIGIFNFLNNFFFRFSCHFSKKKLLSCFPIGLFHYESRIHLSFNFFSIKIFYHNTQKKRHKLEKKNTIFLYFFSRLGSESSVLLARKPAILVINWFHCISTKKNRIITPTTWTVLISHKTPLQIRRYPKGDLNKDSQLLCKVVSYCAKTKKW